MPTYTFKCTNCDREVEEVQSMSSTTAELFRVCTCDSDLHKFKKIIKAAAPVHFKGNDWPDKS